MRIFLDANILFSAANPKWHTAVLVDWLMDHMECITSPYAIEEARRNLASGFPELLPRFGGLINRIVQTGVVVTEAGVNLKAKDVPILGGAIASKAMYLLTGDQRDFGHLLGKSVQGVKIVTQKMLVGELQRQGLL